MSESYEVIRKSDPFAFSRSEIEFFYRPVGFRFRRSNRSNRFENVHEVGRVWRLSKHSWGWRAFSQGRRRHHDARGKAPTKDAALQACMQTWKKL